MQDSRSGRLLFRSRKSCVLMRNPFQTPFAAVFTNEVLLNTKRVAPYALMIFFASNAVLWWGWGPAVERGWATNSDFYIRETSAGFSFILGLPIFTAIMMGDTVVRDFRLGVDPLIFSKPVGRAAYLLGKFWATSLCLSVVKQPLRSRCFCFNGFRFREWLLCPRGWFLTSNTSLSLWSFLTWLLPRFTLQPEHLLATRK